MKKLIDKIKQNKLRTFLVGMCIFLFGFITFQIFSNMKDTYAIGSDPCPSGTTYNSSLKKCTSTPEHNTSAGCSSGTLACGGSSSSQGCSKYVCIIAEPRITCRMGTLRNGQCYTNPVNGSCPSGATCAGGSSQGCSSCVLSPTISCSTGTTYNAVTGKCVVSAKTYDKYICSTGTLTCTGSSSAQGCSQYTCVQDVPSACYLCGNSQGGTYKWGQYQGICTYMATYSNQSSCLANNPSNVEQQTPLTAFEPSTGTAPNPSSTEEPDTSYTMNYYKITYNLDSGKLISGETTKIQYTGGDKAVGTPKTNPIKEGYSFVYWELPNGTKFDFSTKLDDLYNNSATKNMFTIQDFGNQIVERRITLKAKYVEYNSNKYKCNSGTIFDPSTNKCYIILEDTNYPTSTKYKYIEGTRLAWGTTTSAIEFIGAVYNLDTQLEKTTCDNNNVACCEGKCNRNDGKYAEYSEKDVWLSNTTCFTRTKVVKPWPQGVTSSACINEWSSIIYNETNATEIDTSSGPKEIEREVETSNDESSDITPDEGKSKSDNAAAQVQTGDALIIVAFAVGLGALGYTAYYFQKKKKNAEI